MYFFTGVDYMHPDLKFNYVSNILYVLYLKSSKGYKEEFIFLYNLI